MSNRQPVSAPDSDRGLLRPKIGFPRSHEAELVRVGQDSRRPAGSARAPRQVALVRHPLWPGWVISRPRRIPPTDPASSGASASCMPAHDAVSGYEQIVMIFSCSDRKPSDHLRIKIPRIGVPPFWAYPRMNAEESGSRIRMMGPVAPRGRCRCRSPDLCLIIRAAGTAGRDIQAEQR
jgi:hypothetical protein